MRPFSSSFRAAVVALVVCAPLAARADDETAESHVLAGLTLRREHRNEEALAEFRRAFELAPTPRERAQIGLAEQALGRWAEAEADLQAALSAREDEWIARNREPIETALRAIAEHLGWLTVTTNDAQASVSLDSVPLGSAPGKLRVAAGAHTVRVAPSGGGPALEQSIEVPGRDEVHVVMLDSASLPAPAVAPPSGPPVPLDRPVAVSAGAPPATRALAYALGAVGIAGLATGAVLGGLALHERSVVGAHCINRRCDAEGLAAGDVGPSLATWSTVAFGAGALSLGAGAGLLLLGPTGRPSSGGVALRVQVP